MKLLIVTCSNLLIQLIKSIVPPVSYVFSLIYCHMNLLNFTGGTPFKKETITLETNGKKYLELVEYFLSVNGNVTMSADEVNSEIMKLADKEPASDTYNNLLDRAYAYYLENLKGK